MEASAAGLAPAGDAQAEGAPAEGAPAQQQPDLAALAQQLQGLPGELEQMRGIMEQFQAQQQPAEPQAPEAPQPDFSFLDQQSPAYDPEQAAAQLLDVLGQQNAAQLQAAVGPLQQQIAEQQSAREADALAAEFPDLQNSETADAVLSATADWVKAAGLPPEAAGNMQVVRAVYMMGRAAELHNAEQAGGTPAAASLEGAGGASPGGGQSSGLTAESIVAGGGRSPLPFG